MKNLIDLFLNRSKYVAMRQMEKTKLSEQTTKILLLNRKNLFDNFTCNTDFDIIPCVKNK